MNIRQDCLISLLKDEGFDCLYMDNYYPGRNIYFYSSVTLVLTDNCLSENVALDHLEKFAATDWKPLVAKLSSECNCEIDR
jgi:hypothetical protein